MSLIQLFKANPESFEKYLARQIVAFAGDGNLKDNSDCSNQLRAYLKAIDRNRLDRYARECLEQPFPGSGFFLQDVVNELGRRLEFDVENDRYRGTSNAVGFDGLWRIPNGPAILVEVKATDTYNVSLETVAKYRQKLISTAAIDDDSSILFVVGCTDTGALEAQIRGSRYAWDMRVVGVDRLIKLVAVKEKSSEDQTVNQIRELLRAVEYTRIDRILDVVFSATIDAASDEQNESVSAIEEDGDSSTPRTPQETIEDIRGKAIDALNAKLRSNLVRRRKALFEDRDGDIRACVTISKRYDDKLQPYWYAYHPKWDHFLGGSSKAYMVFCCVDRLEAFAIPLDYMRKILPSLNRTLRPDNMDYWHVKLAEDLKGEDPNKLLLFASKTGERFDLSDFRIELAP